MEKRETLSRLMRMIRVRLGTALNHACHRVYLLQSAILHKDIARIFVQRETNRYLSTRNQHLSCERITISQNIELKNCKKKKTKIAASLST
ncbi:unnamed protein product, partial [Trichogramma brassicae]